MSHAQFAQRNGKQLVCGRTQATNWRIILKVYGWKGNEFTVEAMGRDGMMMMFQGEKGSIQVTKNGYYASGRDIMPGKTLASFAAALEWLAGQLHKLATEGVKGMAVIDEFIEELPEYKARDGEVEVAASGTEECIQYAKLGRVWDIDPSKRGAMVYESRIEQPRFWGVITIEGGSNGCLYSAEVYWNAQRVSACEGQFERFQAALDWTCDRMSALLDAHIEMNQTLAKLQACG